MVLGLKRKRPKNTDLDTLLYVLKGRIQPVAVCLSNSWGGLEQIAAIDSVDLARLDIPYQVMVIEGSPIHEYLSKFPEVGLISLPFQPRNVLDFKLRLELKRLVRAGNNLFHVHQTSILSSIVPWLWNERHLVIMASRHILNSHNKKGPIHRWIYRRLDAFVVMSEKMKRNALSTHALKEKQVRMIPYGIDFEKFDPEMVRAEYEREKWGIPQDSIVIGLVGRIDPAKGQATFIRAAAGLMKGRATALRDKIRFVIVGEETRGSSENYLAELKKMVKDFHLEDCVVFAGFQENIPEVMKAFDIFVMPSRQEAFGLVALEAMAMQTPVVISDGGSADEIVGDSEYGLLVRPEDAFDLQSKVKLLIENEELRVKMGEKARRHVLAHYDRRERIRRTLELYEWCLRKRGQ